jgi:Family of unknown function (DUF6343)
LALSRIVMEAESEMRDKSDNVRRVNGLADPTDFSAGLPDYHDPSAGFGGAPPASSALTLRLVLAIFGFVVCMVGAVAGLVVARSPAFAIILAVFAAVAAVDVAVILHRKRRGEPG